MKDFWEDEKCECCGGIIVGKKVTIHRKNRDGYVLIENVPAGVCKQCGMRNYTANVLKNIEESIRGSRKAERRIQVPVYQL